MLATIQEMKPRNLGVARCFHLILSASGRRSHPLPILAGHATDSHGPIRSLKPRAPPAFSLRLGHQPSAPSCGSDCSGACPTALRMSLAIEMADAALR